MNVISDEVLAQRVLDGDNSSFEELVNRYKGSVFAIVYRMVSQYQDAEDISQDVFMNVYRKLYQFDRGKRFSPWIHRIAVNTCISHLRKRSKVVSLAFDEAYMQQYEDENASWAVNPQAEMEKEELRRYMDMAIGELPEAYRILIVLRYQMEYSNQEISEILGISKENVEVKTHRARKALRKIIVGKAEERGNVYELSANR